LTTLARRSLFRHSHPSDGGLGIGMMSVGYIGFFVLLAAPFVLAWLPLFLWRILGNEKKRPVQPVCARCRYPTRDLSTSRCPECGADLLRDGVITPSMRVSQGGGALLAAAAWTIVVGIGAMLLAAWASFAIPVDTEIKVSVRGAPASGQFRDFAVRGTTESSGRFFLPGFGSDGPADLTLVVHDNNGESHSRTFTRESGAATYRLDDGRVVDEFSFDGLTVQNVVKEILVDAGAASDSLVTSAEALEISNVIAGSIGYWNISGGAAFVSVSNSTMMRPKSSVIAALASLAPFGIMLVGVGAWIAGLIILIKQHGKRFQRRPTMNHPDTADAPPASST
jgi:hypothetical protein